MSDAESARFQWLTTWLRIPFPRPANLTATTCPPPDVYAPVIAAYMRDVDRTMLRENLKRTPEERLRCFKNFVLEVDRIRGLAKKAERQRQRILEQSS